MKLFLLALGLTMVLEGVPYFLSPERMKEVAQLLQKLPDSTLRILGLGLIILGLMILLIGNRWA